MPHLTEVRGTTSADSMFPLSLYELHDAVRGLFDDVPTPPLSSSGVPRVPRPIFGILHAAANDKKLFEKIGIDLFVLARGIF